MRLAAAFEAELGAAPAAVHRFDGPPNRQEGVGAAVAGAPGDVLHYSERGQHDTETRK